MLLIDTDVMVDVLRGTPPAVRWLENMLGRETLALPGLVAMELIQGCRNRQEVRDLNRHLDRHTLYWPSATDCQRAMAVFSARHLSHRVGLIDALVAETVKGLGAKLATFNIKHYSAVPDLNCMEPYKRA